MRVGLLGPLEVVADDGSPVEVGGARLRMLLARLALEPGRPVSAGQLIDDLWGEKPPNDAANALQSLVSRLRKVCPAVTLEPGGYRLGIAEDDVDVFRFERLRAHDPAEALALWRGDALVDLQDAPFAQVAATKLHEARLAAEEERGELDVAALTTLHEKHPLRERLAGLLMKALCAQGRQSEALQVYARLRKRLVDELGVDPGKELEDVHLAALRGELGPKPVVDRLPTRLTSFVGRQQELDDIARQLTRARLVTLVGPGGAGKTRLATEVAARHPLHAKGRVWFAALAGLRAGEDIVGAVLGAFDVGFGGDPLRRAVDGMTRIVEVLAAGESLLVLDNCEHLVEAAAEFTTALLKKAPNVRVLATSREALAIEGESLAPVGPLAVPNGVRLFLDRAEAVKPGFSESQGVEEICLRLDGMPLALELAAARLRSMSIQQITERLDDRFRLLTSGSRTALPRQRTLRAVVEWSWDLLTEPERELARRLSVFPSGANLRAIEEICLPDALYVLSSLVEKSIVDVQEAEEPRYRMLETIRVYAAEQLDQAGETQEITGKFRQYYRELTDRWEPHTRTARQVEAIAVHEAEHDNIVEALRGALHDQQGELAAGLLRGVFWYWMVKGDNSRAEASVDGVLALKDQLPDDVTAAFKTMRLMMRSVPGMPDKQETAEVIDECVRTGAIDRFPALAIAVPMLAFMSHDKELAHREVARAAHSSDPWARAAADWALSFVLVEEGDLEGAERARDRAYDEFAATGDRWGSAMTLSVKAAHISHTGDHQQAIALYEQGLALALELRSTDDTVQQRWRLAIEHSRAGDHQAAEQELAEAERYVAEVGNDELSAMILFAKAEVRLRSGNVADAKQLTRSFQDRINQSPLLGPFAEEWIAMLDTRIALAENRFEDAEKAIVVAIETTSARGDIPDLATITELLAQVRFAQHRPETAHRLLALAQRVRGGLDRGDPEVRRLLAELGDPEPLTITRDEALTEIRKEAGVPD